LEFTVDSPFKLQGSTFFSCVGSRTETKLTLRLAAQLTAELVARLAREPIALLAHQLEIASSAELCTFYSVYVKVARLHERAC
jgi:hypothetical protein